MEPITLLIFFVGVFVTGIAGRGIYLSNLETMEQFEQQRNSKLEYRTEEEFIGKSGE